MNAQKRHFGFTLIELLVVISIIAILLSIIMPALSKVKHTAMVTICKNNLKQLGLGFSMYANETNRLPDIHGYEKRNELVASDATWQFYVLRSKYDPARKHPINPNQKDPLAYRGFGKLWEFGMLQDPKIYFCPGMKMVNKMNFHSFHNPTDTSVDVLAPYIANDGVIDLNVKNSDRLNAYYSYTPFRSNPIRAANGSITSWPLAKKTSELGSRNVLAADRVGWFSYYSHITKKGGNTALVNMLYGDGRVSTYSNPQVIHDKTGGSSGRMDWFFLLLDDARGK